jgi:hypothetical protein
MSRNVAMEAIGDSVIVTGDSNVVLQNGHVVARDISINEQQETKVISENQAFERIGAAVRLNLDQLEKNIAQARSESNQFFRLTLVFSALGFIMVLSGVGLLLAGQVSAGIVASIASTVPEVTAALLFNKDRELRATIEGYHGYTLDSQRTLTMIDVAETVRDLKERDRIKQEIIFKVLDIPRDSPNKRLQPSAR